MERRRFVRLLHKMSADRGNNLHESAAKRESPVQSPNFRQSEGHADPSPSSSEL
jgi:hypothetical protein